MNNEINETLECNNPNEILRIEHLNNGWLLIINDEPELRFAYIYKEDGKQKYEQITELLWDVLEQLCPNSKHNPYRISVKMTKN